MGAPEASTRPSSPIPPALSPPPIHVGLLSAFYTLEAAGLSCAMVLNRYWDRLPPHTIRQNVFILAPLAVLLASGVYISVCYLRAGRSGTRRLNLTLATNLRDRKSTCLNSSHANISYAVFCLKKKKT